MAIGTWIRARLGLKGQGQKSVADASAPLAGAAFLPGLSWALQQLARAQGEVLDPLRLEAVLAELQSVWALGATPTVSLETNQALLTQLCSAMELAPPVGLALPDPAFLPLLALDSDGVWCLVVQPTARGQWLVRTAQGEHEVDELALRGRVLRVQGLASQEGSYELGSESVGEASLGMSGNPGDPEDRHLSTPPSKRFTTLLRHCLRWYRSDLAEASLATGFIGLLSLATSLFSMQVYDRVIPTHSESTLIILTTGVMLTIAMELGMKLARARLMDHVVVGLDNRLSREVFRRLLQLRVDQLPRSLGSLAGQIKGYEQVRSFYTAGTLFALIDVPMGLAFVALMLVIAPPMVAAVPLVAAMITLALGVSMRTRVTAQAAAGAQYAHRKTGLLVETVDGFESIKSGLGGWKFLARWVDIHHRSMHNELQSRHLSETVGYLGAAVQQASYASLIVVGAWAVMQGSMTMGALIACSIISGRILTPIVALPGLLVQQAHARAAIAGLEKLYALQTDHDGVAQVLTPEHLHGHFRLECVRFAYGDHPPSLMVPKLEIQQGERVAVLGPIGAGKSTLLRILSGMYRPQSGRVFVDGLDLAQVHRNIVAEHLGYLQQEHRLFQGTLRENLLIGLSDPGDDALVRAMRRTGMDRWVAAHPMGLDRPITEGGRGLSGGQRQVLALTRCLLVDPPVLLLDEPTASMDDEQERLCLRVLAEEAARGKTVVIVTHKPGVLALVQRIIVIAGSTIVVDGPRDAVMDHLKPRPMTPTAAASAPTSPTMTPKPRPVNHLATQGGATSW